MSNNESMQVTESPPRSQTQPSPKNPLKRLFNRTKTLITELSFAELSGSCGDLGTFIPLFTAMARQRSILLTPALFFAGVSNLLTGYAWNVPMCVQPMKSIAAVALSENLTQLQVTTSGIIVGGLVAFIGITNLIEVVNWIIPSMVVSGIQLGVGFRLAMKGVAMIEELTWVGNGGDCLVLVLCMSLFVLFWLREETQQMRDAQDKARMRKNVFHSINPLRLFSPRQFHPVGIYLFFIGLLFGIIKLVNTTPSPQFTLFGEPIAVWALEGVAPSDWKIGLLQGALPQLPLTTLNSVISVCALASALYPSRCHFSQLEQQSVVLTRKEVCISVGLMNLFFCPFGSMPNCHGAGGLAGQHRFGARHGASVVWLGVIKILLAVFFGSSVVLLLDAFPVSILGIMLCIAGLELASTGYLLMAKDCISNEKMNLKRLRKCVFIATITCLVILGLGKTHYGALCGWIAYMVYGDGEIDLWNKWKDFKSRNKGKSRSDFNSQSTNCVEEEDEEIGGHDDRKQEKINT